MRLQFRIQAIMIILISPVKVADAISSFWKVDDAEALGVEGGVCKNNKYEARISWSCCYGCTFVTAPTQVLLDRTIKERSI